MASMPGATNAVADLPHLHGWRDGDHIADIFVSEAFDLSVRSVSLVLSEVEELLRALRAYGGSMSPFNTW
jgi:hypothetical protein